jgi:hypothetical protein
MGFVKRRENEYVVGSTLLERFVRGELKTDAIRWDDTRQGWEAAPSLVRYADDAVKSIVDSAESLHILREAVADSRTASFGGYGDSTCRPEQQAEALYRYLRSRPIAYKSPPARWVRDGQEIRPPREVIEKGHGTCLDLALLYAAMLEAIGLEPLIFLVHGHALAGFWRVPGRGRSVVSTDWRGLRESMAHDAIVPVDVVLCSDVNISYVEAVRSGLDRIIEDDFEAMIDVRVARRKGIEPL